MGVRAQRLAAAAQLLLSPMHARSAGCICPLLLPYARWAAFQGSGETTLREDCECHGLGSPIKAPRRAISGADWEFGNREHPAMA